MTSDPAQRGEFGLIASLLAPLTGGDERALGLEDDAAVIPQKTGMDTVISTDTLVAGVHFLMTEPADVIARRLLRVNLSDIAAMAARPFAYFLNLTLPADIQNSWLEAFAGGLNDDQKLFGLRLIGGDTARTPGPISLSVTILGEAPANSAVRRSTARAGDLVFVSGTIGDAGLGLSRLIAGIADEDFLVRRYQRPEPRVSLGQSLRGIASSMADVSDGLLADLGHISSASGVAVVIDAGAVPVSEAARGVLAKPDMEFVSLLTSGDDYELVFTVPPERAEDARRAAADTDERITCIGRTEDGLAGVILLDDSGHDITPEKTGYTHF